MLFFCSGSDERSLFYSLPTEPCCDGLLPPSPGLRKDSPDLRPFTGRPPPRLYTKRAERGISGHCHQHPLSKRTKTLLGGRVLYVHAHSGKLRDFFFPFSFSISSPCPFPAMEIYQLPPDPLSYYFSFFPSLGRKVHPLL